MAKQKSLRKKSDSFFAKIAKVNKVDATDATLAFDADGDGMYVENLSKIAILLAFWQFPPVKWIFSPRDTISLAFRSFLL